MAEMKQQNHENESAISIRMLNFSKSVHSTSLLPEASTQSFSADAENPSVALTTQVTFRVDYMDEVTLTEEVKELIEKYPDQDNINVDQLEQHIFTELQCNDIRCHDKQEEIRDIMQNVFKLQGKDNDKKPYLSTTSMHKIYDEKQDIDGIAKFASQRTLAALDDNETIEIHEKFKNLISGLLPATEHCKQKGKPQDILKQQNANPSCMDDSKNDILDRCPCLQRICVFLEICHDFPQILNKKAAINFADYLQINEYNGGALYDDFTHVNLFHTGHNHKMQKIICSKIKDKYECKLKECYHKDRHKKRKNRIHVNSKSNKQTKYSGVNNTDKPNHSVSIPEPETIAVSNTQDVAFSQLIDSIHFYFLHSDVSLGCHPESSTESKEMKSKFLGRKSDTKWIKSIEDIDIENEQKVYDKLVLKMGVYRWQRTTSKKEFLQELIHLKPRWANVKQEVLNNTYCSLSKENWNQTVTKVMQFKKSFAAERMRTLRDGQFYDETMENKVTWKKGEVPNIPEIMVIKLYTDWNDIQSELKKCFRFTSAEDIVQRYATREPTKKPTLNNYASEPAPSKPLPRALSRLTGIKTVPSAQMLSMSKTSSIGYKEAIEDLKNRIQQFFHWRANLLIFINKFSEIILPAHNNKEFILYHGVNRKMLLSPSSTTSFWGPLSTSASYYVAQQFATDKGMILALTSQYPRARLCNAFNASVISDYPEEQEYLIGHIYLRVRRVYTKSFQLLPMNSKLKFSFFVIHLFREKIFAMNSSLESFLIPFIKLYLMDVMAIADDASKQEIQQQIEQDEIKNNNLEYKYLKSVYKWGKEKHFDQSDIPTAPRTEKKYDKYKTNRIFYIMIKKFKEIVEDQMFLKLDCISPGLRPYFLKDSGTMYKLMKRYNGAQDEVEQIGYEVSFKKLIALFPNVEQIVFLNWYKFDDDVLERLISQIRREKNQLKCVKFLYYDYNDSLKDNPWFFDPIELKEKSVNILKNLKWEIRYKEEKAGYSIKLKELQKQINTVESE